MFLCIITVTLWKAFFVYELGLCNENTWNKKFSRTRVFFLNLDTIEGKYRFFKSCLCFKKSLQCLLHFQLSGKEKYFNLFLSKGSKLRGKTP